jgi:hypothetical protein
MHLQWPPATLGPESERGVRGGLGTSAQKPQTGYFLSVTDLQLSQLAEPTVRYEQRIETSVIANSLPYPTAVDALEISPYLSDGEG